MKTRIARLLSGETIEFTVSRRTDMQERANFAQRRNAFQNAVALALHGGEAPVAVSDNAPLDLTVDDVFTRSQLYDRSSAEKKAVFHTTTIGEFRQSIGFSVRQVKMAFKDRRFTVRQQISYEYDGEFGGPCVAVHVTARFFVTRTH